MKPWRFNILSSLKTNLFSRAVGWKHQTWHVFAPWFTGFIIIVRIKIVTYQYPQADEIFLYLSIILDIVGYISDYILKFTVILSNRAQVLWIDKLVLICSNARIHWHSMHHIAMCFVTNCFTHLCVLSSRDNTDHLQWLVLSEMELAQWWTYLDEDIYNQQWYIYMYIQLYIYIHIWVNFITTSLLPNPGIMVFIEESSQKGRKFQVSELL